MKESTISKRIMKALKKKYKSTTELAQICNANYYATLTALANLKALDKVDYVEFRGRRYWKIKEKNPVLKMEVAE